MTPSSSLNCPQCGAAFEAGDRFCGSCGAALAMTSQTFRSEARPERADRTPPTEQNNIGYVARLLLILFWSISWGAAWAAAFAGWSVAGAEFLAAASSDIQYTPLFGLVLNWTGEKLLLVFAVAGLAAGAVAAIGTGQAAAWALGGMGYVSISLGAVTLSLLLAGGTALAILAVFQGGTAMGTDTELLVQLAVVGAWLAAGLIGGILHVLGGRLRGVRLPRGAMRKAGLAWVAGVLVGVAIVAQLA